MEEFVELWIMHTIGGNRRKHLEESDQNWEKFHQQLLQQHDPKQLLADQQVLFRVHTTLKKEPQKEDYEEERAFKKDYQKFLAHQKDEKSTIDFDQHWVSFTDDPSVIASTRFEKKRLRGLVMVAKPKQAIKVYPQVKHIKGAFYEEKEVVAPLKKDTILEILSFQEFIKKYIQ